MKLNVYRIRNLNASITLLPFLALCLYMIGSYARVMIFGTLGLIYEEHYNHIIKDTTLPAPGRKALGKGFDLPNSVRLPIPCPIDCAQMDGWHDWPGLFNMLILWSGRVEVGIVTKSRKRCWVDKNNSYCTFSPLLSQIRNMTLP